MRPFRTVLFLFLVALLLTFVPTANAQLPTNAYFGGGSYSSGATPAFALTGLYTRSITDSTAAFTIVDVLPESKTTVSTSIGVGIAQRIATIGNIPIFAPTEAGVTVTGNNTGWSYSFGAAAPFQIKPNWYIMPIVRGQKESVAGGTGIRPIIGVLIGFGKK